RRTHVQAADIDMSEHAVAQPVGVEDGAELLNVVGEVFWWDHRVFDEGHGAPFARDVAQEPNALLPKAPEGQLVLLVGGESVAGGAALLAPLAVQELDELTHLAVNELGVRTFELDEVDRGERCLARVVEQMPHAVPDNVALGE